MTDDITDDDDFISLGELMHYGVARRSGRYPWGSGQEPNQRHVTLLSSVEDMHKKGMTELEIAKGLGINTAQLRARKQIAKNEIRKAMEMEAVRLKEKQMSNVAIGEQMGINESSVRALLNPALQAKADVLQTTANMLKAEVEQKKYIDVGLGVESQLGISAEKLKTAVQMLREEGYTYHYIEIEQQGTGQLTKLKVLAPPETPYREVFLNQHQIKVPGSYSEDKGHSFEIVGPPKAIDAKRVGVRYADEGGADMDGVIQVRRGVEDVSLGNSRYAQVRIKVGDGHYLKGMAMYGDDLPDGVDLMFNTNKKNTGNKLDAMKEIDTNKSTPENPFGSTTRQHFYTDKSGKKHQSTMNIVNEEGDWSSWSKNLSSQMMSKQPHTLAKQQLDLKYQIQKNELDEINKVTNPAVKRKLLESFSDGADASAVHLKAAGLPRTANHVILPINSLKDNEIYAPGYKQGERVVLIRHPHGGKFEIPELVVNNRNREAGSVMKQALDAVGINSEVAKRLSGADFDGDTVLVIPNNSGAVKNSRPLAGLKDFDPQVYKNPPDVPKMTARNKQLKMGDVSNLITDMTIKGAPENEIARAVRHSMVVIDAEKHNLNWKQSAQDHGIAELKRKYQGDGTRSTAGASTIISKSSSDARITRRVPRPASQGGPIDKATGKLVYIDKPDTYVNKSGQTVERKMKVPKMALVDDAFDLTSGAKGSGGRPIEAVYATHANRMKALANEARKEMVNTKNIPYSPSAKVTYKPQVDSLKAKLLLARQHKPQERQAQLIAAHAVKTRRQNSPDMDAAELKKIRGQELKKARERVGGSKPIIEFTPLEWEAIQSGAIANNMLEDLLANANIDQVRQMATPREPKGMSTGALNRAKSMLASGYTQGEIAELLGISTTILNQAIAEEEG